MDHGGSLYLSDTLVKMPGELLSWRTLLTKSHKIFWTA